MVSIPNKYDFPAVAERKSECDELRAKVKALDTEREATLARPRENEIAAQARRLRSGGSHERSIEEIDKDLTVHGEALRQAERDLAQAESEASRSIAEQKRPEYEKVVRRGAKIMSTLADWIRDERAFREALRDADVQFTSAIRPMALPRKFDETDCQAWLVEAAQYYGISA